MTRLGNRQLETLILLARPTITMIVPGPVEVSLIKRGLLKAKKQKKDNRVEFSFARITPKGLRAIADAMEAGRVEDPLVALKRDAKERKHGR